jgi:ubiquinol-cytochrome c reductase iron-sulfur subunit
MDNADQIDKQRRRFLTQATAVVGGLGLGLAAIPFVGSWLPSAKAKALGAPVELDISKIEPGQKITVAWRGQPVFVVHRTDTTLKELQSTTITNKLRDPGSAESIQPEYAKNPYRSSREHFLVVVGICTHLGCVPVYNPKVGSIEPSWLGGFFCPCHGSKYDMSGRVYKGVPAPTNLTVPPYKYVSDNKLLIGSDA